MRSEKDAPKKSSTGKSVLFVLISIVLLAILFIFFKNKNATTKYDTAIDQGMEAVEDGEYKTATGYFEEALAIKSEDEKAEILYQNSWLMYESKALYIDYEFDQSLEKVNQVLETESDVTELDLLFAKAEELKKDTETILADQAVFQNDFDEAKAIYGATTLDETQVEQILDALNHILAHEQINEPYHQEIKEVTEELIADVQAYQTEQAERKVAELAKQQVAEEAKQKEEEAQHAKDAKKARVTKEKVAEAKNKLSGYSALEIEYARVLLMIGYPGSSTVYVSNSPAGTAVTSGYEETVKFPGPTVTLSGEYGADGLFVYTPLGDGYIKAYPVPGHWHQEDQSPAGYRAYAQEILDKAETMYIDPGNPDHVLQKLQSTTFINDY